MFAQTRQRSPMCYPLTIFLFAVCTLPLVALYPTAHTAAQSAAVSQLVGSDNIAEIVQEDAPQAEAAIDQEGISNYALIMQSGPAEDFIRASISQTGDGHATTIEQSGIEWYATAEMTQTGSDNTVSSTQTNAATARAEVLQDGTNNTALLSQTGGYISTRLDQVGHRNTATVNHVSNDLGERSDILQEGHDNSMDVVSGGVGASVLVAQQIGTANLAHIDQTLFGETPLMAEATVRVEGDGNTTIVDQSESIVSLLTVDQNGHFNHIQVDQEGDNSATISSVHADRNSDDLYQAGNLVYTEVGRSNTHDSTTRISQNGFSETIRVEQTDSMFASAEVSQWRTLGSRASIRQATVSESSSVIEQTNDASTATLEQTDTAQSSAEIRQMEGSLIASIYQSSGTAGSFAEIEQVGGRSTATIRQTGVTESTAQILQTDTDSLAEITMGGAISSTATIVQSGEGYTASIRQGGIYNSARITQM